MTGQHEMLESYLDTISGEPWLRTLVEGASHEEEV